MKKTLLRIQFTIEGTGYYHGSKIINIFFIYTIGEIGTKMNKVRYFGVAGHFYMQIMKILIHFRVCIYDAILFKMIKNWAK